MYKKGFIEFILDIILVSTSYFFGLFLSDAMEDLSWDNGYRSTIPVVIITTIAVFRLSGIYKGLWELLSVEDIYTFLRATFLSVLAAFLVNRFAFRLPFYWDFYFLFGLLLFFTLVGSRLSFRFFDALIGTYELLKRPTKIFLYGAGTAGKLMVDEIKRNEVYRDIRPIGFVDDEASKHGHSISGIKIIGDINTLARLLQKEKLDCKEIWISSRNIPPEKINELKAVLPKNVSIKRLSLEIHDIH